MTNENIMTTQELATYIKLNEKTVLKRAQTGEIPGVKIGKQWRFHLAAVDHYIQKGILDFSDNDLNLIIKTSDNIIPLSKLTNPALINLNLKARNKDELLSELATMATKAGITNSMKVLLTNLSETERMLTTAVGQYVAIPHARHPSKELFEKPNIIIARSKKGIGFDAPDKKKVHLFFMTCPSSEFVHIRLLAKISKMLHIPNIIQRFIKADTSDEVIKILLEFERMQILPSV